MFVTEEERRKWMRSTWEEESMLDAVNERIRKMKRPKAKVCILPRLLGQVLFFATRSGEYVEGKVLASFYYPGGSGYFIKKIKDGKIVQNQGSYKEEM